MPTRNRNSIRPEKRARTATPAQIDKLRDRYVEMIAMARKFDSRPSAMIDKAHSLLTRHWGYSDWAARAAILKTVDWLLNVAMVHPGPDSDAHAAPAARSAHRSH